MLVLVLLAASIVGLYHALEERSAPLALGQSISCALALFLFLANLLVHWMPVQAAALTSATMLALGSAAAARACRYRPSWPKMSKAGWGFLVVGFLFLLGYIVIAQNIGPDDDYWIHTPLEALMRSGHLPAPHPFFSDILMNGHYGRDLMIAVLSEATGQDVFLVQAWHTALCQLLTFWILFFLTVDLTGSVWQAALATTFVFLGIGVGGRGGMIDTFQNNNALVYTYSVSLAALVVRGFERPTRTLTLVTAAVLAGYAVVYETHFGLVAIVTVCLVALGGLFGREVFKRRLRFALPMLCLAVALSAIEGGPISQLATRLLQRKPERVWTTGEMNQHQIVKLTFPKKKLFQIQLGFGTYQRVSCGYLASDVFGPKFRDYPQTTPYRPIWSWDVLRIHWLPTLLSPLTLLFLWRRRDPVDSLGMFFWLFGAWAYLIPSLVDFGPIYEFEYFRWQFAAGFGFAISLGMVAGQWMDASCKDRPLRQWLVRSLVAVMALVTTLPVRNIFLPRLYQSFRSSEQGRRALLFQRGDTWLLHNSSSLSGITAADIRVGDYLARHGHPGERMLTNFFDSNAYNILVESTLIGMSGVSALGHSMPLDSEPVGTPPYHMNAPARAFWGSHDPTLLSYLGADWVYVRYIAQEELAAESQVECLTVADVERVGAARFVLFRVTRHGSETHPELSSTRASAQISGLGVPLPFTPGTCRMAHLTLNGVPAQGFPAGTRLFYAFAGSSGAYDPVETVAIDLPRCRSGGEYIIPLVLPHAGQNWIVRFWLQTPSDREGLLVGDAAIPLPRLWAVAHPKPFAPGRNNSATPRRRI